MVGASLTARPQLLKETFMKLHCFPFSTYTRKVLLACYETGFPIEQNWIFKGDKNPNPLGKVPFLEPKVGAGVPEATTILEYLALKSPDTVGTLFPKKPDQASLARRLDRLSDLYLLDTFFALAFEDEEKEMKTRRNGWMKETVANLEGQLEKSEGPFLLGENVTWADLGPSVGLNYLTRFGVSLSGWPRVVSWLNAMRGRSSWKQITKDSRIAASKYPGPPWEKFVDL